MLSIQTEGRAFLSDVRALHNVVEADIDLGSSKLTTIVEGDCAYVTFPHDRERAVCAGPCAFNGDAELDRLLADCGELARRYAADGVTDVRVLVKRGATIEQFARYNVA